MTSCSSVGICHDTVAYLAPSPLPETLDELDAYNLACQNDCVNQHLSHDQDDLARLKGDFQDAQERTANKILISGIPSKEDTDTTVLEVLRKLGYDTSFSCHIVESLQYCGQNAAHVQLSKTARFAANHAFHNAHPFQEFCTVNGTRILVQPVFVDYNTLENECVTAAALRVASLNIDLIVNAKRRLDDWLFGKFP